MIFWNIWWVWVAAGLLLALLELLVPAYIFLGFALGAAATGLLLAIGGPLAEWMATSPAGTLAIFAALSLLAWLAIRQLAGHRRQHPPDKDINKY